MEDYVVYYQRIKPGKGSNWELIKKRVSEAIEKCAVSKVAAQAHFNSVIDDIPIFNRKMKNFVKCEMHKHLRLE